MQIYYCALLALTLSLVPSIHSKPNYIECESGDECGTARCCMIGMNRYSMPTCLPISQVNEPCRPWDNLPINMNISYPDGEKLHLNEVYKQFCPCDTGLFCSLNTLTCIQPSHIDNEIPHLYAGK